MPFVTADNAGAARRMVLIWLVLYVLALCWMGYSAFVHERTSTRWLIWGVCFALLLGGLAVKVRDLRRLNTLRTLSGR